MKYWLMMACLFIMVWKSQQSSIGRGTYKKMYGSKNPKKKLNVVYEMCMTSTPAYISATARPVDSSLPHTFKVTVVDIQRYSVLVELERTDQKSGWDEIWLAVDWIASDNVFRSCNEYFAQGFTNNGTYEILLPNGKALNVSCYMEAASGGWTFVQRRQNGSVDFYQDWANYTNGFGNLDGDFWLGLENLHLLTRDNKSALRIDIKMDCYGYYWSLSQNVQYSFFHVASAAEAYKLNVGGFNTSSWLGDILTQSNGYSFSTYDNISDHIRSLNCTQPNHGGWWRYACSYSSINGVYAPCQMGNQYAGWYIHGHYSANYMAMMIKERE
ncbi:microfibril-associated glycoprotein 4-like [Ciona intestinalis]